MTWKFDKNMTLLEKLENWEEQVRAYERRFDKVMDEDTKISILLELAPKAIEDYVLINSDKYTDYDTMREKLVSYLDTSTINVVL